MADDTGEFTGLPMNENRFTDTSQHKTTVYQKNAVVEPMTLKRGQLVMPRGNGTRRDRKFVDGETGLTKGFCAKYGIRESLKQYGVRELPKPEPAPVPRVLDEAAREDPPFTHTMQYMTDGGTVSYQVNPRLSTRTARQRPRSRYVYEKNATSRRPSSAWFEHPKAEPLVREERREWR